MEKQKHRNSSIGENNLKFLNLFSFLAGIEQTHPHSSNLKIKARFRKPA